MLIAYHEQIYLLALPFRVMTACLSTCPVSSCALDKYLPEHLHPVFIPLPDLILILILPHDGFYHRSGKEKEKKKNVNGETNPRVDDAGPGPGQVNPPPHSSASPNESNDARNEKRRPFSHFFFFLSFCFFLICSSPDFNDHHHPDGKGAAVFVRNLDRTLVHQRRDCTRSGDRSYHHSSSVESNSTRWTGIGFRSVYRRRRFGSSRTSRSLLIDGCVKSPRRSKPVDDFRSVRRP